MYITKGYDHWKFKGEYQLDGISEEPFGTIRFTPCFLDWIYPLVNVYK